MFKENDFKGWMEKIEEVKKGNLDLSRDEDLSIAIMNLISLEEHFYFSAMKTDNKKYIDMLHSVREMRKELLKKILKEPKAEEWCLPPKTIIFSNLSGKKINDFKHRDLVLTHSGRFMPVTHIFRRKYSGKLIKVIPCYTNIPLLITPEHPVLCATKVRVKQKTLWRKNFTTPSIVWKKAKELNPSDFLIFPRYRNSSKLQKIKLSYSWISKGTFKKPTKFKQEKGIVITNELMELIGLYIAEGCISRTKYYFKKEKRFMNTCYISWTFSMKERELAAKVVLYLKNIFDIDAHVNKREGKNTIDITSSKRILIKFFEQFGTKSHNKILNNWVMELPKEKFFYLFKGLIEGDGCISKFAISYATSSENLAYQLRLMLFREGILHNLSKRTVKDTMIGNRILKAHFPLYNISVSGDSARLFCRKVNLKYNGGKKTSGNFGFVTDKFVMIPIRAIKKENYNGSVMNFSVMGDESYTTLNGVVHNCISKHLLAASMRLIEVGTKELSKDKKEANKYFKSAFELYSLFFAINLKMIGVEKLEKIDKKESKMMEKFSNMIKKIVDCCKEW